MMMMMMMMIMMMMRMKRQHLQRMLTLGVVGVGPRCRPLASASKGSAAKATDPKLDNS